MAKQRGEDKKPNGRKNTKQQSPHSQSVTGKKKRSRTKLCSGSGIAKSKQLLNKLNTTRSIRSTRAVSKSSKSNGAPRVCGNGMPMPSLAELERMYDDDSDDDENNNEAPTTAQPPATDDHERCKTPVHKPLVLSEDKLTSPTTLKVIASKMMDLISNLPVIEDNHPPPPVIPPKKRKKSGIPHIVGCKERRQVPWAPKTSFCKGDEKYGVEEHSESNDDDENSCPKKRRRFGKKVNVSKSIFNAKSDEIASWLKQSEQLNEQLVMPGSSVEQRRRTASSDSDKTVDYNFGAGSPENMNRFSPLPSTSRDNDTFLKNDQLFNESLSSANPNKTKTGIDEEIEIVEAPGETVVIDDSLPARKIEPMNYTDDDCCVIVEPQSDVPKMDTSIINIDSPNDNGYGSLDFNLNLENSDCEIIDVDDVLAESQAIIAKYKKQDGLDSVTVVDPCPSFVPEPASNSPPPAPGSSNLKDNPSTIQEPTENVTEMENISVAAIEEVVTNFFVNSNYATNDSSTVELTEVSEIPREWSTWISSLPPNNVSLAPTLNHRRDPPSTVRAPATVSAPVVINVPAANTLNLVITDLSHVSSNRNRRSKTQQPPPTIPVIPPPPVQEPPRNMASKNLGDCPICMESLGSSPIASTLCGHIFCMDCIKASIRTNGKRCPTCRKVLKANGYHQLFL